MNQSMKQSQITSDSPNRTFFNKNKCMQEALLDEISKNTIIPFVLRRFNRESNPNQFIKLKKQVKYYDRNLKLASMIIFKSVYKMGIHQHRKLFIVYKYEKLFGSLTKITNRNNFQATRFGFQSLVKFRAVPKAEIYNGIICLNCIIRKKKQDEKAYGLRKIIETAIKSNQKSTQIKLLDSDKKNIKKSVKKKNIQLPLLLSVSKTKFESLNKNQSVQK